MFQLLLMILSRVKQPWICRKIFVFFSFQSYLYGCYKCGIVAVELMGCCKCCRWTRVAVLRCPPAIIIQWSVSGSGWQNRGGELSYFAPALPQALYIPEPPAFPVVEKSPRSRQNPLQAVVICVSTAQQLLESADSSPETNPCFRTSTTSIFIYIDNQLIYIYILVSIYTLPFVPC